MAHSAYDLDTLLQIYKLKASVNLFFQKYAEAIKDLRKAIQVADAL